MACEDNSRARPRRGLFRYSRSWLICPYIHANSHPLAKDKYVIGGLNGVQMMDDNKHGTVLRQSAYRALDFHFIDRIDICRHFVEHNNRRVLRKRARDGHALFLSAGKAHAVFPDNGIVSGRKPGDKIMNLRLFRRFDDFLLRGVLLADCKPIY